MENISILFIPLVALFPQRLTNLYPKIAPLTMLTRRYFKVFKSGRENDDRNALCAISLKHPAAQDIVDNFILRSGYISREVSFSEMLNFPGSAYSVFRIGAICVDVAHSLSFSFSSVFLKFFRKHFVSMHYV